VEPWERLALQLEMTEFAHRVKMTARSWTRRYSPALIMAQLALVAPELPVFRTEQMVTHARWTEGREHVADQGSCHEHLSATGPKRQGKAPLPPRRCVHSRCLWRHSMPTRSSTLAQTPHSIGNRHL